MIRLQTNHGKITVKLYEEKAPETCANFKQYVESGFYDNTIFHRVIKGFMIQGGGFSDDMQQKSGNDPIKNEADNGIKNEIGTLAMARTSDPHSASSQFFINASNNSFLDFTAPTSNGWGYCVFGKVVDGLDIIKTIEAVSTESQAGHQDVPSEPVVIEKAEFIDD